MEASGRLLLLVPGTLRSAGRPGDPGPARGHQPTAERRIPVLCARIAVMLMLDAKPRSTDFISITVGMPVRPCQATQVRMYWMRRSSCELRLRVLVHRSFREPQIEVVASMAVISSINLRADGRMC